MVTAAIMGGMAEMIDRPRSRRGNSNGHGGESKGKNGFLVVENNNLVSEPGAPARRTEPALSHRYLVLLLSSWPDSATEL